MKIRDYLNEIQHAVETTITEVHREHNALARTHAELARLTPATEDGYTIGMQTHRSNFMLRRSDLRQPSAGDKFEKRSHRLLLEVATPATKY
jgi:hypothetical protein